MLEMERGSGTESADGLMQVSNEFRAPEGVDAADVDAATDGQLMAVLDLRQDESLAEEGLGREVVNRVQKLRKKAGLVPEDAVNVYLGMDSRLASALSSRVLSRFHVQTSTRQLQAQSSHLHWTFFRLLQQPFQDLKRRVNNFSDSYTRFVSQCNSVILGLARPSFSF